MGSTKKVGEREGKREVVLINKMLLNYLTKKNNNAVLIYRDVIC